MLNEVSRIFPRKLSLAWVALAMLPARLGFADNPIIQTKYTADPAPLVYNGTVYLYTSHDEDTAVNFVMYNWMLYTSTDMANWTDHGIVAGVKAPNNTFPWAAGTTHGPRKSSRRTESSISTFPSKGRAG